MENNENNFSDTLFPIERIEAALMDHVPSLELNKVCSAYEISEKSCSVYSMPSGSNFFFHTTRVVQILIQELGITDPSQICAALLHNPAKLSNDLNTYIIDYNFGAYVAYLVDIMLEEFFFLAQFPHGLETLTRGDAQIPIDDYLLLMCSEQLDYLRCIDYDITGQHFDYLSDIAKYIFPLIKNSDNQKLQYLFKELVAERNKILS